MKFKLIIFSKTKTKDSGKFVIFFSEIFIVFFIVLVLVHYLNNYYRQMNYSRIFGNIALHRIHR